MELWINDVRLDVGQANVVKIRMPDYDVQVEQPEDSVTVEQGDRTDDPG